MAIGLADHQDIDGIGVCCVFYGGTYDHRSGECYIDDEAKLAEAAPDASVPPKWRMSARLSSLPIASVT